VSAKLVNEVSKDRSMEQQKAMLAEWFTQLSTAKEQGRKVAYTFVPGNLVELLAAFDVAPVYPEINALQSGMRKKSAGFIREAERAGHSEDVCTYVKCDLGMLASGNVGPTGETLPRPDLLLLSYTGCFTFLKWFELLKEEYGCELSMLHIPYVQGGVPTREQVQYVVRQLQESVIPTLEKLTGKKYDPDRLREHLARSARAEDDLVRVLEAGKVRPSPIDAYFGGVYYVGPIFTAFRGTAGCEEYYASLRAEVEQRIAAGEGPLTPEGPLRNERFRLVVEGPPNWTSFREFWKIFYDEGAVVVASSYTKVGGLYDRGFRHDPKNPLETLAEYCLGCYTNLSLPTRVDLLADYVRDYEADGFLINSIKSCNSFSAGQLVMMRELEKRTGLAGGFIESDLVDPRYFSHANIKNRVESYLQMIDQRRRGASTPRVKEARP
jgi:benzoyl-CoA reductase subunit B